MATVHRFRLVSRLGRAMALSRVPWLSILVLCFDLASVLSALTGPMLPVGSATRRLWCTTGDSCSSWVQASAGRSKRHLGRDPDRHGWIQDGRLPHGTNHPIKGSLLATPRQRRGQEIEDQAEAAKTARREKTMKEYGGISLPPYAATQSAAPDPGTMRKLRRMLTAPQRTRSGWSRP